MGNRAVITTQEYLTNPDTIGVYLHWNGGRDSVQAFLLYCKLKGYRPPETDCYGWARPLSGGGQLLRRGTQPWHRCLLPP